MSAGAPTTTRDITDEVVERFGKCPDDRLRLLIQALVRHLHAFTTEVQLTDAEWRTAIERLTDTGHLTSEVRQEWILWSDTLGLSMLVDLLGHPAPAGATESTVLGPFYVPGSPERAYGERIDEQAAGEPLWVAGVVRSLDGTPLAGAELDVWQNGENELYAVQDAQAPEDHLRGRFRTREDGSYGFLAVPPTAYPIPDDGPVGQMLTATGRHPWRPAHIHLIVRAEGHRTLTTHVFDAASRYLDSDAVFAVKPSLVRTITRHSAGTGPPPVPVDREWWSLEFEIVLVPSATPGEPVDDGRTA